MFFKDPKIHGEGHNGALNQEVLRVLIDRVKYLEQELPSPENETILHHLRCALIEHEVRALRRKNEKGKIKPENMQIDEDVGILKLDKEINMELKDPKEIENALRVVMRSGKTTSMRSSDGTRHGFHRYDSAKINVLIKELERQLPELVENAKKPSLEEIDIVKDSIEFYKNKKDMLRVKYLEDKLKELEAEYGKRVDI